MSGRCAACDIWLGFGSSFNQGREDITSFRSTLTLCHLQTSSFCLCFHQSLGSVKLPSCLLTMFFDLCSSQNLQGISLRSSLCTSSFGYSFSQKHEGFTSFANLHTLCHVVLPSADIEPYPLSHPGYEERQVARQPADNALGPVLSQSRRTTSLQISKKVKTTCSLGLLKLVDLHLPVWSESQITSC